MTTSTSYLPPKKIKQELFDPTNKDASKVVFMARGAHKLTFGFLFEMLGHFGPIAYARLSRKRSCASVEFETFEAARSCVSHAQSNHIILAGRPLYIDFSHFQVRHLIYD